MTAYQSDAIFLWLRNSAVYSFVALVITLCVAIPAGYALAMTEFRGRRTLLVATLVVMLMPNATLVVPLFLEVNAVHLIGSMWSIILPYAFYPFGVYLTYIYFSTALPRELLDAARLDGCSEFGAFRRVALPLAAPIVALVGFFSFVANWTNYFLPYVMLPQSSQFPVQVGLGTLLDNVPAVQPDRRHARGPAPRAGAGHPAGDHPRAGRLPVLPALPGRRNARRRDQGLTDPSLHPPAAAVRSAPAERGCGPSLKWSTSGCRPLSRPRCRFWSRRAGR